MPLYHFQCLACGAGDDVLCKYTELNSMKETHKCKKCGAKTTYQVSGTAFNCTGVGVYKPGMSTPKGPTRGSSDDA